MIHTSLLCTSYTCNSRHYFLYLTTTFIGKQWHLKTEVKSQNLEVWQTQSFGKNNAASDSYFEKVISAEDIPIALKKLTSVPALLKNFLTIRQILMKNFDSPVKYLLFKLQQIVLNFSDHLPSQFFNKLLTQTTAEYTE